MSIKTELIEECKSQIGELHKLQVGSEDYKVAVEGVTKLGGLIATIEKNEQEAADKEDSRIDENELKVEQMLEEKKDRRIRYGLEALSILGTLGLTAWGFVSSMNFEKTGHLWSTEGGRAMVRKILKIK